MLFLNHKMVILPQTNMEQNECIADLLFRPKLRLDNPGGVREYNFIMQIIMECLIGWNFKLKKQTSLGILEKFLAGVTLLKNKQDSPYIFIFSYL